MRIIPVFRRINNCCELEANQGCVVRSSQPGLQNKTRSKLIVEVTGELWRQLAPPGHMSVSGFGLSVPSVRSEHYSPSRLTAVRLFLRLEMLRQLRALLLFLSIPHHSSHGPAHLPAPTGWRLTAICNYSSRRSNTLLWPAQAPAAHTTYRCTHRQTLIHIK